MTGAIVCFFLLAGAVFMFLAALGVFRMPDLYTRMQTTTKAITLGIGCMMIAVTVFFGDAVTAAKASAIVVFFYLTAPVGAHILARAAYRAGIRVWDGTVTDELRAGRAGQPSQEP